MKRRTFLVRGSLLTTGFTFRKLLPRLSGPEEVGKEYELFKDPPAIYRPFVRWWWNGDKIEKKELTRELHLLKEAGIGGVEINPIKFPERTDDLHTPAVEWLGEEWLSLFQHCLTEAKSLDMTCDLIVGSGWPFGAEWLEGDERSQVVVIGTKKLEGPLDYEISLFELFKEADPAISSPFPGRKMEMLSVKLVPAVVQHIDEVQDLTPLFANGDAHLKIPEGKHVLYALVKISGFMEVINGAPGATGPVLNHYNEAAVLKYLHHMSDRVQKQPGDLSGLVRAFFTDSLELEGANWCSDMQAEFQKRRGYDLMPWLPFLLFKTGGMGNTFDYGYGADFGPVFLDEIQRKRYDFELTKAELLKERFLHSFIGWCRENKLLSRAQAYGRGYFPLEGSFDIDLPECETWIKYGLGTEMSETDYRIGRAYTMINKFVSSAAHLKGKRHISCEELTNTDMVFNETLETLKLASDQSILSGVTHPIFHGFNYSPLNAVMPGWIRYGCYINEKNPWWPWFHYFTGYRARLSAILQQADMFADIAILLPVEDTWSLYGAQNEPFPALVHPEYQTLIWEAIHRNGCGCDYLSAGVCMDADIHDGYIRYRKRKYHSIFLVEVESMEPAVAQKLFEFVAGGGRVFCIEKYPVKSPGWTNHTQRDLATAGWVEKAKSFPDRFILLRKPEKDFTGWFKQIQEQYAIAPYIKIGPPGPFVSQVRYQSENWDGVFLVNSHAHESFELKLTPGPEISHGRQTWIWDAETGNRYRVETIANSISLTLGPADSRLMIFDKSKKGPEWKPVPLGPGIMLPGKWSLELQHFDGTLKHFEMDTLTDLVELTEYAHFCGTVFYRKNFHVDDSSKYTHINLGKVWGISELVINGQPAGSRWFGLRIYEVGSLLKKGDNSIEVRVTTVMGNYLKSCTNNPVAQYWTNEKRKNQPMQSMGLVGPVSIY